MAADKPKRRNDVKREIADNKKEQNKRLDKLKKVANDKKVEATTSKALKRAGTVEGVKATERGVTKAADVTVKEFQKQERAIKREVFNPAQKREKNLDRRAMDAKADTQKLNQATSRMDTAPAKENMRRAASSSEQDQKFLKTEEKDQAKNRTAGEKETQRQKEIVDRNRLAF